MPDATSPGEPDPQATRPVDVLIGRAAWVGALGEALSATPDLRPAPQQLLLWSRDFAEWPLDDPAVHIALSRWLRGQARRLVFIGRDFEAVSRRHPRLTRWRRDWAHRIDAWQPTLPIQGEPLGLLLGGARAWVLLDDVHWRTKIVSDAPSLRAWREQSDACLQRCEPAWPVTMLGL